MLISKDDERIAHLKWPIGSRFQFKRQVLEDLFPWPNLQKILAEEHCYFEIEEFVLLDKEDTLSREGEFGYRLKVIAPSNLEWQMNHWQVRESFLDENFIHIKPGTMRFKLII